MYLNKYDIKGETYVKLDYIDPATREVFLKQDREG